MPVAAALAKRANIRFVPCARYGYFSHESSQWAYSNSDCGLASALSVQKTTDPHYFSFHKPAPFQA